VTDEVFSCTQLHFHIKAKRKDPAVNQAPHYENVWGVKMQLFVLNPSALEGNGQLHASTALPSGRKPRCTWGRSWVGPTAGLGAMKAFIGYGTPAYILTNTPSELYIYHVVPCENTDVSKEYTGSVSRVKVCKI
jgi:hypothetical protein